MRAGPGEGRRVAVVGLGNPDRGDDAVGPAVAGRVAALQLPGLEVLQRKDPTSLIHWWGEQDLVVVVDAVRSNRAPGTLRITEAGVGRAPLTNDAWAGTGRGGTHAFGLAAAVELSRALGRLPRRLVLVGVEAERLDEGVLSPAVRGSMDRAVGAVCRIVTHIGAPASRPDPRAGPPPGAVREVES